MILDQPQRVLDNGPLFGRLPASGRSFLRQRGWIDVNKGDNKLMRLFERPSESSFHQKKASPFLKPQSSRWTDSSCSPPILSFIWPNKSGPQFETDTIEPAVVRPYPKHVTDILDDKLLLAERLTNRKLGSIMPQTIPFDDIIANKSSFPERDENNDPCLYFVKHRHGAQGKSVYVHDLSGLQHWAQTSRNPHDFVIQNEVPPALDNYGRKFVLRAHILLFSRSSCNTDDFVRDSETTKATTTIQGFLHEDIICLPHTRPYNKTDLSSKASHISQAGKQHPSPMLIADLDTSHPACETYGDIVTRSAQIIKATAADTSFCRPPPARGVTCFALLGADYLVSKDGDIVLCEVNSHPALGWGSMSGVPKKVFVRLIDEFLGLMLGFQGVEGTGFHKLDLDDL